VRGALIRICVNPTTMSQAIDKKIFIVDDDPFWTTLLAGLLAKSGFKNVHTFNDGKTCIDNLNQEPSLLFVDFNLEGLHGYELLKEIIKLRPNSNIVICTASDDVNLEQVDENNGRLELLIKSNFDMKAIKGLIN
jgi:DNA-binding NtrC family response regulator